MYISELNTNISDSDFYEGLKEVHDNLALVHNQFDTHSMNEYALHLQGQKELLGEVISYLRRIIGEN